VLFVHQEEEKCLVAKTIIEEKITWYNLEQKTCTETLIPVKENIVLI